MTWLKSGELFSSWQISCLIISILFSIWLSLASVNYFTIRTGILLSGKPITGTSYYFYMVALTDWVTNCSPIFNWRKFPAWRGGKGWSVGRLGEAWWWCFSYWFVEFSPGGHRRRDFKLSRYSTTNGMSLRSSPKRKIAELYSSIYPRFIDWGDLVYLDWTILLIGFSLVKFDGISVSWLVHIFSGDMWIIWQFSLIWLGFCIKITCCGPTGPG